MLLLNPALVFKFNYMRGQIDVSVALTRFRWRFCRNENKFFFFFFFLQVQQVAWILKHDDYKWGAWIGSNKAPTRNHTENWKCWGGLHWWIASIFRALFPQNGMPRKHDWASDVATLHTKKDCGSFIHLLSKRQASPRHSDDKYFKASFSSRRYRLLVYCLPSTAGRVEQAQTSFPICSAAFDWPYFGEELHCSKHFHIQYGKQDSSYLCGRQREKQLE